MSKVTIYTDLDGSLLDHDSYSHAPADTLLQELEKKQVPVILSSSKTRAEMLPLRKELNNTHPFIVENGAAIFIPKGYFANKPQGVSEAGEYWNKAFSHRRAHWLDIIDSVAAPFIDDFIQFNAMDTQKIIELTGLNEANAKLAAQREFGEPIYWHGSEENKIKFIEALKNEESKILTGGRFIHISGDNDKGKALLWLNEQYKQQFSQVFSIAIGDSHNDIAMLEAANQALLIRSHAHQPPQLRTQKRIIISDAYGPEGWDQGVRSILELLKNKPES